MQRGHHRVGQGPAAGRDPHPADRRRPDELRLLRAHAVRPVDPPDELEFVKPNGYTFAQFFLNVEWRAELGEPLDVTYVDFALVEGGYEFAMPMCPDTLRESPGGDIVGLSAEGGLSRDELAALGVVDQDGYPRAPRTSADGPSSTRHRDRQQHDAVRLRRLPHRPPGRRRCRGVPLLHHQRADLPPRRRLHPTLGRSRKRPSDRGGAPEDIVGHCGFRYDISGCYVRNSRRTPHRPRDQIGDYRMTSRIPSSTPEAVAVAAPASLLSWPGPSWPAAQSWRPVPRDPRLPSTTPRRS